MKASKLKPAIGRLHIWGVKLTDDAAKELGFNKTFWSSVVISLPVSAVSVVGDVITLVDSIKCLEDVVERLDKK